MQTFWRQVEHYNQKLILPAIVLLLFIIIIELFFHLEDPQIQFWIHVTDAAVIAVFLIDLMFLARKAKTTKVFFRRYWLDIIAVFPFNLLFDALSRLSRLFGLSERVAVGQAIFHEGLEAKKIIAEEGKLSRFLRPLRIGTRLIRIAAKTHVFTHLKPHRHKVTPPGKLRR